MKGYGKIETIVVTTLIVLVFALLGASIFGAIQQNTITKEFAVGKQNTDIKFVSSGIVSKIVDNDNDVKVLIGDYKLDDYDRIWMADTGFKGAGMYYAKHLEVGKCYELAEYISFDWNFIGMQTNGKVYIVRKCN